MSGCKGEEALAEYNRALEIMLAKKAAPKRAAPSETEDEVQFIRSSKRQAATALASSSKKKSKASESTPKVSPLSSSDPAKVLANLNTGVSFDPGGSAVGGSSASIQFIQSDLLQVTRFSFLFLSVSRFLLTNSPFLRRRCPICSTLVRGWVIMIHSRLTWMT